MTAKKKKGEWDGAARLVEEINRRFDGNLLRFQEKVAATGVLGSSYPSIHAYTKGTEPGAAFLRAAADVLNVPVEYLAFGSEPAPKSEAGTLEHPFSATAVAAQPDLKTWPHSARLVFLETLESYLRSYRDGWNILVPGQDAADHHEQAIGALAVDLYESLGFLALHNLHRPDPREYGRRVISLLIAVSMWFPPPGQGKHIFQRFPLLDPEFELRLREFLPVNRPDATEEEREAIVQEYLGRPITAPPGFAYPFVTDSRRERHDPVKVRAKNA